MTDSRSGCVVEISTDTRPIVYPTIDWLSTDYRPLYRPLYRPIDRSTLPTVNKARKILRFPMLCTCETQGAQHMISMQKQKFSSLPRVELRTLKRSPGAGTESTACNPAAFICNFYYLFGFQFRVILPFSSPPLSQVHYCMLAMQWMEKRVYTTPSVQALTKKAILGGE